MGPKSSSGDKNMLLFKAVLLLLINNVRTDDNHDIQRTVTEEVVWMFEVPAGNFVQKDKEKDANPNTDKKFAPDPDFNRHMSKRAPGDIDWDEINARINEMNENRRRLDSIINRIPPTIDLKTITIPPIKSGMPEWMNNPIYTIAAVVILIVSCCRCCFWLKKKTRKSGLNRRGHIVIIASEQSPSQTDCVPLTTNPVLHEMGSSQSDSPLPKTDLEAGNTDSQTVAILIDTGEITIPVKSQRDASAVMDHPQLSGVEDLKLNSGREGVNTYPEPPPPYLNCVREDLIPPPEAPPPYE